MANVSDNDILKQASGLFDIPKGDQMTLDEKSLYIRDDIAPTLQQSFHRHAQPSKQYQ